MRRTLACLLSISLLAATMPSEALAQVKVALPGGASSVAVTLVPGLTVTGTLPGVTMFTTSLAPSLSPTLVPTPALVSAAAIHSVVPAAAQPVVATPKAALVTAAARLSAASLPERPAEDGKKAGDEVFSGEAKRPASDSDPVVPETPSNAKPALSPSTPSPAKKLPLVARWKAAVTDGAGPLVLAAFAWNFLTVAAYSIIGPARGAILMTKFGPETLPWVYMASAALTGVVVFVYNRFSHAPRKFLIGGSLLMLAGTLIGGAAAVSAAAMPTVAFGYYLWTDVFGIMSATLFWTYANDVFTHDESKRLFGFIAAGAPLGSIAGTLLMKVLVGSMGPIPMLMIAAGIFAAVLPLFLFMENRAKNRGAQAQAPAQDSKAAAPEKGILKTILGSKFLIFLTLVVALERLVPDITNYLYSFTASHAFPNDPKAMAQLFADVSFYSAVASFAASSILVGLTLRKLGTGASLMTTGLVNLAFFALFPFMPTVVLAKWFYGLDGVTRYTWFKTAKESTYAATDHDTIYRVKAFVEMFVYRFARGVAGLLLLAVAWFKGGPAGAAMLGVPFALLWLYAAWRMGREHKKLEDANDAAGKK